MINAKLITEIRKAIESAARSHGVKNTTTAGIWNTWRWRNSRGRKDAPELRDLAIRMMDLESLEQFSPITVRAQLKSRDARLRWLREQVAHRPS